MMALNGDREPDRDPPQDLLEPGELDELAEAGTQDDNILTKVTEVDCKTSLAAGFSRLFNEKSTSDVILVVGNQRYFAHKTVLSASSEYFYHMFYGAEWKESTLPEIELQETPACQAVFDGFIRYFYTGVVNISPQIAPDLLTLADKYTANLKQNCEDYMIETINKGNIDRALAWILICNQLKVFNVLERCFVIICYNLEKAAEMPGWKTLNLTDILTILQRDDIVVPSEYNVYVAIQTWILNQRECPLVTIKELLTHVQFKCMASFELIQVETSALSTAIAHACMKDHLYDAFRFHAVNHVNMENRMNSIRTYTKNKLQKTRFNLQFFSQTANVTPICFHVNHKAKLYTWLLKYTQVDGEMKFTLRLEKASREQSEDFVFSNSPLGRKPQIRQKTNTYNISQEIPYPVCIEVKLFLQNGDGVVNIVAGKSVEVKLPECPFQGAQVPDLLSFSVPGLQKIPEECFLSFLIKKIESK